MSKAFILVGGTGCGKTHFSKQCLQQINPNALLVFDVNNEYYDYYNVPFDPDIDKFLSKAYKVKNAFILIEDATAFLSNRGRSDLLTKVLVSKRHSKNTIFLLFHSFRAIPKYIFDLCTHVVIFNTNDPVEIVENGFQNNGLTNAFLSIRKQCENHPFWKEYPPPPGIAPPSMIFKIY